MLDAIALYFRYWSNHVISLRIVTTDLDLLSCTSRKDKTNSDLIRNAVLLWNNVVLCVIFECKRIQFRFLHQYRVFCAVLKSIDNLFFSCEFALRFINQITVCALFLLVVFRLSLFMIDTSDVIKVWFWVVKSLTFDRHFHYFNEWSFLNFAAFHRCRMIIAEISTDEHCCWSMKWYCVCFFELLSICTHSDTMLIE